MFSLQSTIAFDIHQDDKKGNWRDLIFIFYEPIAWIFFVKAGKPHIMILINLYIAFRLVDTLGCHNAHI